jgi:hypothetical protein
MSFVLRAGSMPLNPHTLRHFNKGDPWLTDPAMWVHDYAAAKALADALALGVSLIIRPPLFAFDLDDCLRPDGTWSPLAIDLCARFPGAYIEVSQGGEGLHIIGTLAAGVDHRCKNTGLGIEFYTQGRAIALTGTGASGSWATVHDVTATVAEFFSPLDREEGRGWTTEASPKYNGPLDDADLIEKALASKSAAAAFGGGVTFRDLWEANAEVLAVAYPHEDKDWDFSSADGALAMHLAFWTGRNCERMRALMWQSGLVREKWSREAYIVATVLTASQRCTAYPGWDTADNPLAAVQQNYGGDAPELRSQGTRVMALPAAISVAGLQFLGVELQCEHFAGCCYVAKDDRIYTPHGEAYKRASFDVMYGGFVFQMDDANKKTTKSAWEAFTQSQCLRHPKAPSVVYRPDQPARSLVGGKFNSYAGGQGERIPGDPSPFLRHCELLLPNDRDRAILLSWMAAVVQHPGVKFSWAPFIQGVEGNGKSLFIWVLEYCVGERNTFLPRADEITEKFNSWMFTHQFIGVHDLYIPHERRSLWEAVKPMITERRQPRRGMASEWEVGAVCANFMINSNHKEAVPRTSNDRRAAPLFTAQQTREDLLRAGMTGRYFPDLYVWLRAGGFGVIAEYLHTYAIPDELNPATECTRAPVTTSEDESVRASMGPVEQALEEAIAEHRVGFRGGYVSSWAFSQLLDAHRMKCSPTKRGEILAAMGYDKGGRLSAASHIDGGTRPWVYIKSGLITDYLNTQLSEA